MLRDRNEPADLQAGLLALSPSKRRAPTAGDPDRILPLAFAGLAVTLIGNGIGRFAYTPLIPALIAAGWFMPAEAAYLAAANLAGYLAGALGARRSAMVLGSTAAMRWAMIATVVSLAACAWPLGFVWYLFWRFLAGVTGGVLMVLAAPAVLGRVPPARRGRASGIVFTGVGIGMAAAGTIVPLLARQGLPAVWFGLAAAAALLTVYAWFALPRDPDAVAGEAAPRSRVGRSGLGLPLILLLAAYALDAVGFVPHTVFWVDYIARSLRLGLDVGGAYWILFGLAAAGGPFLVGLIAERIGFGRCYIFAMAVKAAGVALPLLSDSPAVLASSTVIVGALIAGTTTLCSGWVLERVGVEHHRQVWGWMTSSFAVAQAGSAWGFSMLFATTHSYTMLFALGAAALGCGALLALASSRR